MQPEPHDANTNPNPQDIAATLIAQVEDSMQLGEVEKAYLAATRGYGAQENPERQFDGSLQAATGFTTEQKVKIARAIAIERLVLNAVGNMHRAALAPTPQERFVRYITRGLSGSADEKAAFLKTLKAAREEMIINVVQTMHPTIYHTLLARQFETALTALLEANQGNPTEYNRVQALALVKQLVTDVVNGKALTPNTPVRVAEENALDRVNHMKMQEAAKQVVKSYNEALAQVAKKSPELADQLQACALRDEQCIYRTWSYGADADGRDHSTSIVLWDGIYHQVDPNKPGEYKSRRRDPRENAKDQKQCINGLLQRAYLNAPEGDRFKNYCKEFTQELDGQGADWHGPDVSTVLQLPEEKQAEFFKKLLNGEAGDVTLVPPSLAKQTIAFNEMFYGLYKDYIRKARHLTEMDRLPDIHSLNSEEKKELANEVAGKPVSVNGHAVTFTFDPDSMLYYPTTGENSDFLKGMRITSITEDGVTHTEAKDSERRKLLDVVKRLQVFNHAIGQYGDKVADRYQVANFEHASDFYATLLLLKETGLVTIEKGEVTSAKLAIQPLLETEDDQKRAPELFRQLLEDPLVLSYYKALGNRAQIMVGYSDGAKSAGNMASEWSIYTCTRELQHIFAEHGIEVSFFHGRGRGDSRGGQFDEGQNHRMSPPELHRSMRYDETMQSDAPLNGAISPSRGQDTLASVITGVLTAKQEAEAMLARREVDLSYESKIAQMDAVMDHLTQQSGDAYRSKVATDKNAEILINAVPDNMYKSSRPASRGSKAYADMRAIPVEYAFNTVHAPLHYIGMKSALDDFMHRNEEITDESGKPVQGQRALETMYRMHPFFHNMIDKTAHGMVDYDPAVFRAYAKVAGVSDWAAECIAELDGLRDLALSISSQKETKAAILVRRDTEERYPQPLAGKVELKEVVSRSRRGRDYETRADNALRQQTDGLDNAAHALALSECMEGGQLQPVTPQANPMTAERYARKAAPADPQQAELMRLVAFTASETNRNRGLIKPPPIAAAVEKVPYLSVA